MANKSLPNNSLFYKQSGRGKAARRVHIYIYMLYTAKEYAEKPPETHL